MASTANLGFDLLEASQAQKHVTVNEALSLLDAMCQPVLQSLVMTNPPVAETGRAYGVPVGATGAWEGQGGRIAVASNGGWLFLAPRAGWRAWVADAGAEARFDGTRWLLSGSAASPHGAASLTEIVEFEHAITAGQSNQTSVAIPAGTVVIGVTGRVIQRITGQATGWQLGVSGSANRYGSALSLAVGSLAMGLTGQPQAYYSATAILLTAEGGAFSSGRVRLAIHVLRLTPPTE